MQNLLPYRDLTYVDKLSPVITEHEQKAITTKSKYAILTVWLALKVESITSIASHISHISCDKDDNNYDNNRLKTNNNNINNDNNNNNDGSGSFFDLDSWLMCSAYSLADNL